MACRNAYRTSAIEANLYLPSITVPEVMNTVNRMLFGVDSHFQANDLLQNNLEKFEWVVRNKIYPNFYGRYLSGENCLTKEEIKFLHNKGCKIALIYAEDGEKQTEEYGMKLAKKISSRALELDIPEGVAIFLEIDENTPVNYDFIKC